MRMVVADAAGDGMLLDEHAVPQVLAQDAWTPAAAGDTALAVGNVVYVRYRDDERTIEVQPGQSYVVELPASPDVIDVRTATDAAVKLQAAVFADPSPIVGDVFGALEMAPHDHNRVDWIAQLRFVFEDRTASNLDAALQLMLEDADYQHAEELLR